ncbi:hypothetical protein B7463_g5742, partial [Scytalidium lignicola]
MDPNYIDEDEEASAMAAAMGFSSFGTQSNPNKKRKFNPVIDAFVDGQELAGSDRGGNKEQGTGGNTIPLGKPRVIGASSKTAKADSDEIDLGYDDEEPVREDMEEDGPQYIDTSRPAPIDSQKEIQDKIDAILANIEPSSSASVTLPPNKLAPSQDNVRVSMSDRGSIASSSRPSQRGQRNEFWYIGYYDPSFNENPWARLEQEKLSNASGSRVEKNST